MPVKKMIKVEPGQFPEKEKTPKRIYIKGRNRKDYGKYYYQKLKEKDSLYNKSYKEKNREKAAQISKAWYERNKDKAAERMKAWREKNRDKTNAKQKSRR
jgi:hypothetical protein